MTKCCKSEAQPALFDHKNPPAHGITRNIIRTQFHLLFLNRTVRYAQGHSPRVPAVNLISGG